MRRTIIVNVTQRDIDRWVKTPRLIDKQVCEICSVAKAIKRHLPTVEVEVSYTYCNLTKRKLRVLFPDSLKGKIYSIDEMRQYYLKGIKIIKSVAPFKFKMELPDGL